MHESYVICCDEGLTLKTSALHLSAQMNMKVIFAVMNTTYTVDKALFTLLLK